MKKTPDADPDFEKQYHVLYRRLCYSLRKLTNDRDLLNLVVSGSIYEYYQKGHDLGSDDVVKQLYVAVRHRCLNELGKKRTHQRIDRRWAEENMPTEENPFFGRDLIEAEFLNTITKLVVLLPPRYRQAVEGYYLKGVTAKELAGIMGIKVNSVHRLKDLGIEKVARLLKEHDLLLWLLYISCLLSQNNWKN